MTDNTYRAVLAGAVEAVGLVVVLAFVAVAAPVLDRFAVAKARIVVPIYRPTRSRLNICSFTSQMYVP